MICEHCGGVFPEDEMRFAPNPFMSEIYPEDGPYPESWWCDECYQNCADDI